MAIKYASNTDASSPFVLMRKTGTSAGTILCRIYNGDTVDVQSTTSGWAKVLYLGVTGYIDSTRLSTTCPSIVSGGIRQPVSGTVSLNRVNAILYAHNYALGSNSQYSTNGSADCANFVSQCLYAGGYPMYMDTEPSSTGGRNWHYDKPGSAGIGFYQSWYTVAPLVKYLSEVVGCTLTNSKDDLRRGDLAYTPNSSHIVIVSKSLFEDGVFKVCGHTAPVYDGDTPATKFIQMRNSFSASGGHFFRFV